ncbi:MAG: hypothetical protein J5744_03865, partial [Oscillospiraceae bacterium]|nr:hypothetical protein [Oscillospiraceae bacterium]
FFRDTDSGINARVAVLEPDGKGNYYISSELEGPGDGIASFSLIRDSRSHTVLLIEWSSPSLPFNSFAAYLYESENLELGMEENCTDLILFDFDSDGEQEFCYTTRLSQDEGYAIKAVKLDDESLRTIAVRRLSRSVSGIKNMTDGILEDGTHAIFVDEITTSGLQTEILSYGSGSLEDAAFGEGFDILSLTQRPDSDYLTSRRLGKRTCVPSSVPPSVDISSPDSFMYWYTVNAGNVILAEVSYVSTSLGICLCLPSEWMSSCTLREKTDGAYAMTVYDSDNKDLLTLLVLNVSDDATSYTSEGFTLVGNTASSRFYCRFNCSDEESEYIRNNFAILRLGET